MNDQKLSDYNIQPFYYYFIKKKQQQKRKKRGGGRECFLFIYLLLDTTLRGFVKMFGSSQPISNLKSGIQVSVLSDLNFSKLMK